MVMYVLYVTSHWRGKLTNVSKAKLSPKCPLAGLFPTVVKVRLEYSSSPQRGACNELQ